MLQNLKKHLYFLKTWIRSIVIYPRQRIEDEVDYDTYWKERRGSKSSLNEWQKERADIIARVIGEGEAVSILDIGCGEGALLKYLATRVSVKHMIGVDTSPHALQLIDNSDIETVELDFNDPGKLSKIPRADYALLLEVLEHVPYAEKLLRIAFTKSRKGVFFSFPNTGFITYRLRFLLGKFPLQWRTHPSEHVRFWTYTDLKWWLNALGYQDFKIFSYKGIPLLNRIWPSLFSAGLVVYIQNEN